jgi:hypothetical protein
MTFGGSLVDLIRRTARPGSGAGAAARGEELHVIEDDLEFAAFLSALLVFPLVEFETAFNHGGAAFGKVFGDELALFTPSLDVDEGRLVPRSARLVLELTVHSQTELADGRALGRDPQFGVTGKISNKKYFVEICHGTRRRTNRD